MGADRERARLWMLERRYPTLPNFGESAGSLELQRYYLTKQGCCIGALVSLWIIHLSGLGARDRGNAQNVIMLSRHGQELCQSNSVNSAFLTVHCLSKFECAYTKADYLSIYARVKYTRSLLSEVGICCMYSLRIYDR